MVKSRRRFFEGVKRIAKSRFAQVSIALLVASYCCFLFAYNYWRTPENVYEEIYWSLIDSGSARAVSMEGGLYFPQDYLPAFLNVFKNSNLTDMGAVWSKGTYASLDRFRGGDSIPADVLGGPETRFNVYYSKYFYRCDETWELVSGRHVRLPLIRVNREPYGYSERCLWFTYILMNESNYAEYLRCNNEDDYGPYLYVRSCPPEYVYCYYDLETNQLSFDIQHCEHMDDEEALELAEKVIKDVFLRDYFAANPDSKFTKENLGQWSLGEIEFSAPSESKEPEKDHG